MEHGTHTQDNHAALWHGRFQEGPDAAAVEFETSIHVDERMALDDIRGSRAHAKMLGHAGIIPQNEADAIIAGLDSIEKDLNEGTLKIDYSVLSTVTAASVTNSDTTVAVSSCLLIERSEEALFGSDLGKLAVVGNSHLTSGRRRRLI